jgi:adenylate kinase
MPGKGPVIVITGTPGTGKSTHAQMLAQESPVPLKHINVGDLVKEKNLYEEYDSEWESYTVDEDKVCILASSSFTFSDNENCQLLDELEPIVAEGGIILDWHTCEIFPERWPDLVIVLRCDHSKIWERLEKRSVESFSFLDLGLMISVPG